MTSSITTIRRKESEKETGSDRFYYDNRGKRSRIRRHGVTGNYDKQEMEEIRSHEGKRSIQQSGDDYMTWTKGILREGTGGDRDRLWGRLKNCSVE